MPLVVLPSLRSRHLPEMPEGTAPERVGIGLLPGVTEKLSNCCVWYPPPLTLLVELVLFASGAWIYSRMAPARDGTGAVAFMVFLVTLLGIYVMSVFGPPPPSARAIAYTGFALWLLIAWGYWIERHRSPRRVPPAGVQP